MNDRKTRAALRRHPDYIEGRRNALKTEAIALALVDIGVEAGVAGVIASGIVSIGISLAISPAFQKRP